MSKLTPRQKKFVLEYAKDRNGAQAAIRAGYSEKGAAVMASQLLTKPNVQEALEKAVKRVDEATKIDAEYVRRRLAEIDTMDVADLLDDAGNIKPVQQWPKVWRTTISGFDLYELMTGDVATVVRKIKWPDKVKNLELLGKHVDVQAFKDKVEHSGSVNMTHEQWLESLD